jgi:hypothetical protein
MDLMVWMAQLEFQDKLVQPDQRDLRGLPDLRDLKDLQVQMVLADLLRHLALALHQVGT